MLIEAALATVIVGVSIVSLMALMAAGSNANADSRDMTRAVFLAQEIREMLALVRVSQDDGQWGPETGETALASYNDLDDFDNRTFAPPINAGRQTLAGDWTGWSQTISVANVDPNYLAGTQIVPHFSTDMVRVTVTVKKNNKVEHRLSWLVAANATEDSL